MTKSFGIFIVTILSVVSGALVCPRYGCHKFNETEVCAYADHFEEYTEYQLQICELSKPICDVKFGKEPDKCIEKDEKPFRYPGEYCSGNHECFSKSCNGHSACVGLSENATCSEHRDCNKGLYCGQGEEDKICMKALSQGEDCSKGERCEANLICNNGTCTELGSIADGEEATMASACKSFYITSEGKCSLGPKLINRTKQGHIPEPCPDEGKCVYNTTEGELITENCVCGVNKKGQAFCPLGAGDIKFDDYFNFVKKEGKNCHISRGPLCQTKALTEMGDPYLKAAKLFAEAFQGAIYQDNDECVKKILHSSYWDIVNAIEELEDDDKFGLYLFLGVAIGAVVVIAILLLVIYLKKSGGDDDEDNTAEEGLKVTP